MPIASFRICTQLCFMVHYFNGSELMQSSHFLPKAITRRSMVGIFQILHIFFAFLVHFLMTSLDQQKDLPVYLPFFIIHSNSAVNDDWSFFKSDTWIEGFHQKFQSEALIKPLGSSKLWLTTEEGKRNPGTICYSWLNAMARR